MNIHLPPVISVNSWLAIKQDGTPQQQSLFEEEKAFLANLDIATLQAFFYINNYGNKLYGADAQRRLLYLNGNPIVFNIEAPTQVIAFRRTQVTTGTKETVRLYGYGLRTVSDNPQTPIQKAVFIVDQNGIVTMELN